MLDAGPWGRCSCIYLRLRFQLIFQDKCLRGDMPFVSNSIKHRTGVPRNSLIWCLFNDQEIHSECTPAPAFSNLSEFNVRLLQYSPTVEALFLGRAIPLNPLILQYLAPILFSFVFPAWHWLESFGTLILRMAPPDWPGARLGGIFLIKGWWGRH